MSPVTQGDSLPGGWSSMLRAVRRAREAEPRLLTISFSLALATAFPDVLIALWISLLADGLLARREAEIFGAACGLGVSAAANWFLRVISDRTQRRFRERLSIALETDVARLQASVAGIEHQERQDYVDRLAMLRNQAFVLDHMYFSLFTTCGWLLRLLVTLVLLASVHPALLLLALSAVPTVFASNWRPEVERKAEERGTWANRLMRHVFTLATTPSPAKEVRVLGLGKELIERRRAAWQTWYGPVAAARRDSALWQSAGWTVFGLAYVGAVYFSSEVIKASPGAVLLVLQAGARLSMYLGAAVGEIGFLRGFWLEGARRLAWLEDYAATARQNAQLAAPEIIRDGITFEHVSFAYPGTDRFVLEEVNLRLRPGSVVALVGENGAGKSTLIKLLSQLYRPTRGRILIDRTDLAQIEHEAWRKKLAGAFQDFFRFEFKLMRTVGLGDLPRFEERPAVLEAIGVAGAQDVVDKLAEGLDTQLGPAWPQGVDLSFGQWQKLSLARGFMRAKPLLLMLDEPTAALDAETEHALFERFAAAAREQTAEGRITVLVSHRFSTVRMADFIVVLSGSRVVEAGTHEELMGRGGHYSELYGIQAAGYR